MKSDKRAAAKVKADAAWAAVVGAPDMPALVAALVNLAAVKARVDAPDNPPTVAEFGAFLLRLAPAEVFAEVERRTRAVLGDGFERVRVDVVDGMIVTAIDVIVSADTGDDDRVKAWTGQPVPEWLAESLRKGRAAASMTIHQAFWQVHEEWREQRLGAGGRRQHPLARAAAAWLKRPVEVAPDVLAHPHAGILPKALAGGAVLVRDRGGGRLLDMPGAADEQDGDGWLPGFEPGPGPLARIPVLDFLHAGGLDAFKPGSGGPWPLRIAYEVMIDVGRTVRDGSIVRLEYPLKGAGDNTLRAMLWPDGEPKWSRDWPAFRRALEAVDRFEVLADGGASAWLPIRVRSYPVRSGGVLRLDVSLPPGSGRGPRILRRVLRRLGARSYLKWRAWLALAYLWDRSAFNGQWVRATRPALSRDSAGRLLDAAGAVILDKRGKPVTKWRDRRAVFLDADGRPVGKAGEAAREPNPETSRHPLLTATNIVALGYPPERELSEAGFRKRKQRMLKNLQEFHEEGLAVLDAHPDGERWRVLPPGEDPA